MIIPLLNDSRHTYMCAFNLGFGCTCDSCVSPATCHVEGGHHTCAGCTSGEPYCYKNLCDVYTTDYYKCHADDTCAAANVTGSPTVRNIVPFHDKIIIDAAMSVGLIWHKEVELAY